MAHENETNTVPEGDDPHKASLDLDLDTSHFSPTTFVPEEEEKVVQMSEEGEEFTVLTSKGRMFYHTAKGWIKFPGPLEQEEEK